jgi:hypothetical protein
MPSSAPFRNAKRGKPSCPFSCSKWEYIKHRCGMVRNLNMGLRRKWQVLDGQVRNESRRLYYDSIRSPHHWAASADLMTVIKPATVITRRNG